MDEAVDFKWIPPNRLTAWLGARNDQDQPIRTSLHDLLFSGPYDERSQRSRSFFSDTLVLPGFDASAAAARLGADTIARKQGHFEKAIFRGADLRKVNFENAHLEGASFYQAHLNHIRPRLATPRSAPPISKELILSVQISTMPACKEPAWSRRT